MRTLPETKAVAVVPATSTSGLWRRLFSFPTVLAGSLAYLAFILARRDVGDPDLWWHLCNAKFVLTYHRLPLVDTYSYTAAGAHVLPFEWLAELPYYAAFKWGGMMGLFWLVFALGGAIALGVFRLSYLASRDLKNSFVACVGGTLLTAITMGARTLLFGWLYLVLMLLILAAVREGRYKGLLLLPPLFCLWINTHGSWPMGIVLLGIFIVSGLVEGSWGNAYAIPWSREQLWKLLASAGASIAALFVNPFGWVLVTYPFRVLFAHSSASSGGGGAGLANIQEFTAVDFQSPWGKVAIAMIFGLLLVAIFSNERWRLDEIGFTLVALYYSLTYSRFLFLAGILLPPVFARRIKLMTPYERETDLPRPNAVALAVILVLFLVSVPHHFKNPVQYPDGAIAYMRANGIHSHVLHEWVWGGYLMWNMPELKVFIDGRGDPYGNGVFKDYLDAIGGLNPEAVLDKYQVQYVLMPPDSLLAENLQHDPRWVVRYRDKTSVLLGRAAGF